MSGRVKVGGVLDGKFVVLDELGSGGMGVVVKVRNLKTGKVSALKYCADLDPEQRKRFKREVRIMASIDHPNVMPVLDSKLAHDPPYFRMPIARASLQAELPALVGDEPAVLAAVREVRGGLDPIHAAPATHRDLKPLDILRMKDGTLVISDLGLAKFNDRDSTALTTTTTQLGTFAYAAPEQYQPG